MTKRNLMIIIQSARAEAPEDLFDASLPTPPKGFPYRLPDLPEPTEVIVEGRLVTGKNRIELVYEEGEASGMEGAVTSIGFNRDMPELISMIRTGPVETTLVFEEGKLHRSLYHTPFSCFELGVYTLHVDNRILSEGRLDLEYQIEFHGAQTEHCRMCIRTHPLDSEA